MAPDGARARRQINLLIKCPQPVSAKTIDSTDAEIIKDLRAFNGAIPFSYRLSDLGPLTNGLPLT